MNNINLLNFVDTYSSDSYLMEVIYYMIKTRILENNLTLPAGSQFEIDYKYISDPVNVSLTESFETKESAISLLLSLRALQLEDSLTEYCTNDRLIFDTESKPQHHWILLASLVKDAFYKDDEFMALFTLLENLYIFVGLEIDSLIKGLTESTSQPEYKNLQNYCYAQASLPYNSESIVISNNAFVGDNNIKEFVVNEKIEYMGHTAFAYCPNLSIIHFKGSHVAFGKFPIIECNSLKAILVPEDSIDYYQEQLPFYKDIVMTEDAFMTNVKYRKEAAFIHKLDELFLHVSSSYKFLWFLAILSFVKDGIYEIPLKKMAVRMIAIAWPLIHKNRLKFAPSDSIPRFIFMITREYKLASSCTPAKRMEENVLANEDFLNTQLKSLLKQVPFRFLSPWITFKSEQDTIQKSQDEEYHSMYALHNDMIVISSPWRDYLNQNYDFAHLAAMLSFKEYLEKYNAVVNLN